MTLKRVHGPYTILGLEEDVVHGSNFIVHLVLKDSWLRRTLRLGPNLEDVHPKVEATMLVTTEGGLRTGRNQGVQEISVVGLWVPFRRMVPVMVCKCFTMA